MAAASGRSVQWVHGGGKHTLPRRPAGPPDPGPPGFGEAALRLPQAGLADRLLLDKLKAHSTTPASALISAQSAHLRDNVPTIDQLAVRTSAEPGLLLEDLAAAAGTRFLGQDFAAEAGLVDQLGLRTCLARNLAPIQRVGGAVVIATGRPTEALRHSRLIKSRLGPFRLVLAPSDRVEAAVLAVRGQAATQAAHETLPTELSCRSWNPRLRSRQALALLTALATTAVVWPVGVLAVLTAIAVLLLLASTALRIAALIAAVRPVRKDPKVFRSRRLTANRKPFVSILVPLLREERIADRLLVRLSALTYPKDRLEICLIVEQDDQLTRDALTRTRLPPWMRVVEVPPGPVKTKPRALNYALAMSRGSIVGVYDAEDAPMPDQLERMVAAFDTAPPEVVCLQGALDFYNPRQTVLTRLFTLDYAVWFRMMLPGIRRLGLILPLGGTTLFFRRRALERIGGWDAWNVTEDADLGIRLSRQGWATEILQTTTYEEATSRLLPWIRQRSRWIKGYAMTWATHMHRPGQLLRDVVPLRFLGLQIMVLGPVLQPALAPVLWSFWAMALTGWHPLAPLLGTAGIWSLAILFLVSEAVGLAAAFLALRATRHRGLWRWVPMLHLYGWLATLAAWKALAEMVCAPFYWDKTSHGHSRAEPSILRASTRSLVS